MILTLLDSYMVETLIIQILARNKYLKDVGQKKIVLLDLMHYVDFYLVESSYYDTDLSSRCDEYFKSFTPSIIIRRKEIILHSVSNV